MRFNKFKALTVVGATLGLMAFVVFAQQGNLLFPSDLSSRYQGQQLTPAGSGVTLAPSLLDVDSAVGWQISNGGGSAGATFVPAAKPADIAGGDATRVQFTEIDVGQTETVGALFESFTAESGGASFAAGGATVRVTREGADTYVLQLVSQLNGQKSILVSNTFPLSQSQREEITTGGEVNVSTSNRAEDNPVHFVEMDLLIVEGGVFIANIVRFTP